MTSRLVSLIATGLLLLAGAVRAAPVQVDVDTIWDDNDARGKCTQACQAKNLYWTGQRGTKGFVTQHYCVCDSRRPPEPERPAAIIVMPQATPGAPAMAVVGSPIVRYDNTDFMFNDIERISTRSFDECGSACLADRRCVAFTYSQAGSCYKKSGTSQIQHSSFATSGFIASRGSPPPVAAAPAAAPPPPPPPPAQPAVAGMAGTAAAGGMRWVRSGTGQALPADAVAGGTENGAPLFVCRTAYGPGLYPGKVVKGNCNIAYGGAEVYTHDFEVLAGPGGNWQKPTSPDLAGAFVAGAENGAQLVLCQAAHDGVVDPGRVAADKCLVSWGGRQLALGPFNVMYVEAR